MDKEDIHKTAIAAGEYFSIRLPEMFHLDPLGLACNGYRVFLLQSFTFSSPNFWKPGLAVKLLR